MSTIEMSVWMTWMFMGMSGLLVAVGVINDPVLEVMGMMFWPCAFLFVPFFALRRMDAFFELENGPVQTLVPLMTPYRGVDPARVQQALELEKSTCRCEQRMRRRRRLVRSTPVLLGLVALVSLVNGCASRQARDVELALLMPIPQPVLMGPASRCELADLIVFEPCGNSIQMYSMQQVLYLW